MNRWQYSDHWSESQWENEFRMDEQRISRYYRELPGCLDLPGEDDLIRRKLAQAEPVSAAAEKPREWNFFSDEDDEESTDGDWRSRPGAEACRRAEYLASCWNRIASDFPDRLFPAALATSCRFGKILELIYTFSDNSDAPAAMRIGLIKHIVGEICGLLGDLHRWRRHAGRDIKGLTDLSEQLHYFREAALDSMTAIRK